MAGLSFETTHGSKLESVQIQEVNVKMAGVSFTTAEVLCKSNQDSQLK